MYLYEEAVISPSWKFIVELVQQVILLYGEWLEWRKSNLYRYVSCRYEGFKIKEMT